MADKQITELPAASGVTNDTLIPVYVPGALTPAQSMTGAQFRQFGADAAQEQVAKVDAKIGDISTILDNINGEVV